MELTPYGMELTSYMMELTPHGMKVMWDQAHLVHQRKNLIQNTGIANIPLFRKGRALCFP
jgi:hypothetical protein